MQVRKIFWFAAHGLLIAAAGCGGDPAEPVDDGTLRVDATTFAGAVELDPGLLAQGPAFELSNGLRIEVTRLGLGPRVETDRQLAAHLVLRVAETGTVVEDTAAAGHLLSFVVGGGGVIPGIDLAVQGMPLGTRATVHIPSDLAYGERGSRPAVPPNADLVLEIDLRAMQ